MGQIAKEEKKVQSIEKKENRLFEKTVEAKYLTPVFRSGEEIFEGVFEPEIKDEIKEEGDESKALSEGQTGLSFLILRFLFEMVLLYFQIQCKRKSRNPRL